MRQSCQGGQHVTGNPIARSEYPLGRPSTAPWLSLQGLPVDQRKRLVTQLKRRASSSAPDYPGSPMLLSPVFAARKWLHRDVGCFQGR